MKKKIIVWKMGKKEWHSKVWKEKKRELRKELRKLKKGKINKEEYSKKKKEYRRWCGEEKERYEKEEEEKLRAIKTEEETWCYINRFRKRREGVDEKIEMENWSHHFIKMLGGAKERRIMEEEEKRKEENQEVRKDEEEEEEERRGKEGERKKRKTEEEITREELIQQLRKLKRRKAPGENGIENETWRLMPKEIEEVLYRLIKKIWKDRGIPEEWNKGIISPIWKKGDKGDVGNYKGVTLMDTAYKIYANLLNDRLKAEVEEKLEEGQFGFRPERGTSDAIWILNYIANREISKKRGKMFVFFVDLKAAFDKVDRRKLRKMMRRKRVTDQLTERIMETYKETRCSIKIGNRTSEELWMENGISQGCPMSPTLFNLYIFRTWRRK